VSPCCRHGVQRGKKEKLKKARVFLAKEYKYIINILSEV
jgi:hypothetical protein